MARYRLEGNKRPGLRAISPWRLYGARRAGENAIRLDEIMACPSRPYDIIGIADENRDDFTISWGNDGDMKLSQTGSRETRLLSRTGPAERNAHDHANNDADKNNNDDGGETDDHLVLLPGSELMIGAGRLGLVGGAATAGYCL